MDDVIDVALLQDALNGLLEQVAIVDAQGTVLLVNEGWRQLAERGDCGLARGAVVSRNLLELMDGLGDAEAEQARDAAAGLRTVLAGGLASFSLEYACAPGGEAGVWYELRVTPLRAGALVTLLDISERKRQEAEARRLTQHDALTGLANRHLFLAYARQVLSYARRHGQMVAVATIDLDGFKQVNAALGREGGDALLGEIAARFKRTFREGDVIAHLSGDAFAVLLPDVEFGEVKSALARCQAQLTEPFEVSGRTINVGASIGVALFPANGTSAEQLMRRSDAAMYQARGEGHSIAFYREPA